MATVVERESEQRRAGGDAGAAESEQTGNGRRKFVLPLVALLVVAGLVWGVSKWLYANSHESTDDAQVDGHIIPILARVGGYVTQVTVEDNDSVRAKQVLVRIDDAEYRMRLAQADADLAAARAAAGAGNLTGQAEAAVAAAASQRQALEAQIAAAQADYDRAQADLTRMRELAAKHIASQQQLDAARAAADAAAANLQAVQRQAAAGGSSVESARAGVRVAQARLEAAQAARDNAALQLSYTTITAPVSGVVSKKLVEVGQYVQPGQTLMSIVADTGVWVTANFKETQLADMRVGQPVEIEVDAYDGATAEGRVQSLSPATGARFALLPPDNATGNFTKVVQRVPVRIAITKDLGPQRPLRPGLSVTAHVKTK
ncbi:MAG: HlyD family secretion protein [Gemmatimonadaceae bacterium]|nr:HlyD family secretion protein [Gemmatimonadaceae bacterium]